MGKKTLDHYEITPKLLKKVEKLASRGLSLVQIAISIGWCEDTIHVKKKEFPELSEAIKRGQQKGVEEVANSLFKKAKGFSYTEIHMETGKDKDGNGINKTKTIKKKVLPDTTAQIFYLKNRDPQHWQDKQDHNISGDIIIRSDKDDDEL